jgi:hypothetical protein
MGLSSNDLLEITTYTIMFLRGERAPVLHYLSLQPNSYLVHDDWRQDVGRCDFRVRESVNDTLINYLVTQQSDTKQTIEIFFQTHRN